LQNINKSWKLLILIVVFLWIRIMKNSGISKMNWTIFLDQTFLFIYFLSFLGMKIQRELIWEFFRLFIQSFLLVQSMLKRSLEKKLF
jgi:hypothetical protein